jgi:methionyl aminopeptidase
MIVLRSDEEIEEMREAGRIVALALNKIKRHAKAGVTTIELDRIAEEEILKRNASPAFKNYKGFPATACTSINEVVVHGIPSSRKLKDGDIISIDVGVKFKDHYADGAITVPVGQISQEAAKLVKVTEKALSIGIDNARPGKRLGDISHSVQEYVESHNFSVVRAFVGHGIGTKIHEEPEIPNYGRANTGPRLEAGMVLAIEPMVNVGTFEVEVMKDAWTVVTKDRKMSAHFEHTVAIRREGPEILTVA